MIEGVLLSTQEVARQLAVHDSTIRRMLQHGHFPAALKVGGVWKVPQADVDAYVEEQRRERQVAASAVES